VRLGLREPQDPGLRSHAQAALAGLLPDQALSMHIGLQGKAVAGLLTVALVPLCVALLLVREITHAAERVAAGEAARLQDPLERAETIAAANLCTLHLRYGFRARLLEDQQVIAGALREQRFLAGVHRTLPQSYVTAFALLFGGVVFATTVIAIVVARRTSRRI